MEELVEEFILKKGEKFKETYRHSWTECNIRKLIEDVITYYLHNYVGVQTEFFDYEELLKQYNEECIDGFNLFKESYRRNKRNYGMKQVLRVAPNFFIDVYFHSIPDGPVIKRNPIAHVSQCQMKEDMMN